MTTADERINHFVGAPSAYHPLNSVAIAVYTLPGGLVWQALGPAMSPAPPATTSSRRGLVLLLPPMVSTSSLFPMEPKDFKLQKAFRS